MTFTKRLHAGIMAGDITCTVRFWHSARVKLGGRYSVGDGFVEVTKIRQIGIPDITPQLARDSGFEGLVDMLKIARHGSGQNIYLIDFEYREGV